MWNFCKTVALLCLDVHIRKVRWVTLPYSGMIFKYFIFTTKASGFFVVIYLFIYFLLRISCLVIMHFIYVLASHARYLYASIIPLFMQQAFIEVKTIRRWGVNSAALLLAAVSDLNTVVCLLELTNQHVNIVLSSVAPSYSGPPQTQAIMLFTLWQALPRTVTLFLLEVT